MRGDCCKKGSAYQIKWFDNQYVAFRSRSKKVVALELV